MCVITVLLSMVPDPSLAVRSKFGASLTFGSGVHCMVIEIQVLFSTECDGSTKHDAVMLYWITYSSIATQNFHHRMGSKCLIRCKC